MGQNVIGCGRISVCHPPTSSCLQQGLMATAWGGLVPVSIATTTLFSVSLLSVCTNISGAVPSPAEPQACQARSRKIQREVPSALGLIRISHQMPCRSQIQSPPVTTDMGHIGRDLTEWTFCYSLAGGAQGWPGTNRVFSRKCGCGCGGSRAEI